MVKAKDFWNHLCGKLGYTFFAGIPCLGLKCLYDAMNSKTMHYVPTTDINTALGLASGVRISGVKSGVIMHVDELYNILNTYNDFNKSYKIPVLLIVYCEGEKLKLLSSNKIAYISLNDRFEHGLNRISNKLEKESIPCALVIEEDVIK